MSCCIPKRKPTTAKEFRNAVPVVATPHGKRGLPSFEREEGKLQAPSCPSTSEPVVLQQSLDSATSADSGSPRERTSVFGFTRSVTPKNLKEDGKDESAKRIRLNGSPVASKAHRSEPTRPSEHPLEESVPTPFGSVPTPFRSAEDLAAVQGLTSENAPLFYEALENCFKFPDTWATGLSTPVAAVKYDFKPGDSFAWAHARVHIKNCTLTEALCGTNEIGEWTKWHPTVTKIYHIGEVDKCEHVVHGFNTFAVFVKNDFNIRLNRFMFNGMVVETLSSVDPSDDRYVAPQGKRTVIISQLTYIPTTEGVLFIQHAKLDLLFHLPAWLVRWALTHMAPRIISNFQNLANMVQNEDKPYKRLMNEDKSGLYKVLDEMSDNVTFPKIELEDFSDLSIMDPIIQKYIR